MNISNEQRERLVNMINKHIDSFEFDETDGTIRSLYITLLKNLVRDYHQQFFMIK